MRYLAVPSLPVILVAIGSLCVCSLAHAWNAAGHRLVAAIAWQEMSPAARTLAGRWLDAHPDSRRWLERGDAGDSRRTLFIEASTWADELRDDPRFYDESNETPRPSIVGWDDSARHRHWHYLDLPASGDKRPGNGDIDRQLQRLLDVLRDGSERQRLQALPWVIHLVADIHQPLHVGSRGDEGGNGFRIVDAENPRRPESNLHRWWDDLPGPPWLRGERLETAATRLAASRTRPVLGDVSLWCDESRKLAHAFAYPTAAGDLPAPISAEFRARSRDLAEQRIYAAGVRLGQILDKLLSPVSRETQRR